MEFCRQNFRILGFCFLGVIFCTAGNSLAFQIAPLDSNKTFAVSIIQQEMTSEELEDAARKLHKSAAKKFKQKVYRTSAVDLLAVLDFYPEFTKSDEVTYLLANCFYEMGMYESADKMLRHLLKTYSKTPLVAEAILGLQKVWYQKKDYQTSLKFYKALESHYSAQKGIDESRYYAGQTYFLLEDYNLSLNILNRIKQKSNFYPFGLYSVALMNLKKKYKRSLNQFHNRHTGFC